jgi:hypothetical protein
VGGYFRAVEGGEGGGEDVRALRWTSRWDLGLRIDGEEELWGGVI